jgi:hypothetical protein
MFNNGSINYFLGVIMADFYTNPKLLQNGPNYLPAHCDKMCVLLDYTLGDSWATVNASILDQVAMVSGDFSVAMVGNDCVVTTGLKTSSGAIAAEVSAAVALLDTVLQDVLYVAPETGLVDIVLGTPVNYPSLEITWHNVTA